MRTAGLLFNNPTDETLYTFPYCFYNLFKTISFGGFPAMFETSVPKNYLNHSVNYSYSLRSFLQMIVQVSSKT